MATPYDRLPASRFWRTGVAERLSAGFEHLYQPKFAISRDTRIATAGSCFAQNLRRELQAAGCSVVDTEPAPPGLEGADANRFGFGQFSARYGNIYTARQLAELLEEAFGKREPSQLVWERSGRFFDALRPSIEPDGFAAASDVLLHREQHLARVRDMVRESDVFVFTLGLTEAWLDKVSGRVVPSPPGVVAGGYDPTRHAFVNFNVSQVASSLDTIRRLLRDANPAIRMILTVSPVPLTATAGGHHVLVANTYSKSVLRAAAGQMEATFGDVDYFPSYEIVVGSLFSKSAYDANLRTISPSGVAAVMAVFFSALEDRHEAPVRVADATRSPDVLGALCDDALLDAFAP